MISSDEGRRAARACAAQNPFDALPTSAPSGCAISISRHIEDDESNECGKFAARVIVRYREEHELEQAMLDMVLRTHTAGTVGSLCAGRTPPRKQKGTRANAEPLDARSIDELASVIGENPQDVEALVAENSGEPFIPSRFRNLLGRERVYEVRSNDLAKTLTAIRVFLCCICVNAQWSHWGVIDGPVKVELPLRYEATFVDSPGIDGSAFRNERVLRGAIGDDATFRFAMLVYCCGAAAPSATAWKSLESLGTLRKITSEGTRLCLCWPVERVLRTQASKVHGRITNLQIKKLFDRTVKNLKSDPNHWRERLNRFVKSSEFGLRGDLSNGMSLAFVRLEEPDAGPANDLTYSVYRLAFAVEQQLHQPPRDTSSQCADENHPVAASVSGKNDHARQPAQTPQQQKRDSKKPPTKRDAPAVTKSPERKTVQTPQKRLKKAPRKCTFEDPFAFNEDDALLASQDVETPPVFGKVVKRIRAPLADAANTQAKPKKAQLQLQKTNVKNVDSDAPPRKVLMKMSPCHSTTQSAHPGTQPGVEKDLAARDDRKQPRADKPNAVQVPVTRQLRQRSGTSEQKTAHWWCSTNFSWERKSPTES